MSEIQTMKDIMDNFGNGFENVYNLCSMFNIADKVSVTMTKVKLCTKTLLIISIKYVSLK